MPDLATLRFLAPAAGITALAIGLPILLLFYFLKLRRRPVRVSSAMLWRDAARDLQVNVPWRLIRPSWLLLLQILILLLISGALARPVLDIAAPPPGRLIVVVDQSASMGAADAPGGPTRLDRALEQAQELISRIPRNASGTEVSVVSYGAGPRLRLSGSADLGAAAGAIREIEQTDEPGDLPAALQLLRAMTASGDAATPESETGPVRVVFFSDGGDAARPAGAGGRPASVAGLGGVDFEFVRVGPAPGAPTPNAGIVSIAARRDFEDPALIRVFCAVEHCGPEARATSLRATMEGVEVGAWPIELPRAGAEGPGRATRSFDLISPGAGVLELRLGGSDALNSDDAAWIALDRPRRPSVWLVRPDDAPQTAASASLRDAIEAIGEVDLRDLSASEYLDTSASPPDLIVFDSVRPAELPGTPTLSFGAGVPVPGLIVEPPGAPTPTQIVYWVRSDPLMRGVTFPGTMVFSPLSIVLPDASAPDAAVREARPLARGSAGPLIAELRDAHRRVIVGFSIDDTNWWKDPSFPVFIANAVESLAGAGPGAESAGRVVRTGEPVVLPWRAATTEVRVSGPDGFERSVTPGDDGAISVGALPLAGVYSVAGGPKLGASVLDPFESSLATRDALSIGGRAIASSAVERLAPREIWHWLVIAALALLAIEWWAYALRMRT